MVAAVVAADRAATEAPADPRILTIDAGMGRLVLRWNLMAAGGTGRHVGRWTPIAVIKEIGRPTGLPNPKTVPAM
jgi:hypothetical protein